MIGELKSMFVFVGAAPHLCCLFTLIKQTFVFLDFGFVLGIKYNPIVLLVLLL